MAFGFLGESPAGIAIKGSVLQVPAGKRMSIIGGDIELIGGRTGPFDPPNLSAPGGQIHLLSTNAAGEVVFNTLDPISSPELVGIDHLGEMTISDAALINVGGIRSGTVVIRSGELLLNNTFISARMATDIDHDGVGIDIQVTGQADFVNGTDIATDTFEAGKGADIRVVADRLSMDGTVIGARTFASGNAGNITLGAVTIRLTGGAQIDNSTDGAGAGGIVTVTASSAVSIVRFDEIGNPSGLLNVAGNRGNAGQIHLSAPVVTLEGGGAITTITFPGSEGHGGDINVDVEALSLTGNANILSGTIGAGDAGEISIEVGLLSLMGDAEIISTTERSGQGGDITITATDRVRLVSDTTDHGLSRIRSGTRMSGDSASIQSL